MKTFSSFLGMVMIFKQVRFSYQRKFTLDQLIHRPFGIMRHYCIISFDLSTPCPKSVIIWHVNSVGSFKGQSRKLCNNALTIM